VTPIAIGDTRDRIGAFMVQAGGWIVNQDGTAATADTPQNLQALQYVQSLLKGGLAQYPKQLDAGWAGEAFGKGKAAIAFEGSWIKGAMQSDYPSVKYTVNAMPAGPKGQGTLSFTQCWGISAKTKYADQAIKFVEAMTSKEQQITFAKAFGVMPSRQSVKDQYTAQFPMDKPFIDGAANGQGPVNAPKMDSVLSDFDAGLQQLAAGDPAAILQRLQKNATAALGG
jgi:multiple sugar transport system substrate-binding protein